jgi:Protein of unknown function (DUF1648)
MKRNWFITFAVLMWLAPVVVAYRYWQVWQRLPVRMVSHFDAAGHANGWMPRETSLYFTLGSMTFVLTVFSSVLFLIARKYSLAKLSWALLAFFHLEVWMMAYWMNSIVNYNLDGSPIAIAPFLVLTPTAVIVLLIVALAEKRGERLPVTAAPDNDAIVEEVHNGRPWSGLFLIPIVVLTAIVLVVPNQSGRLAMALVAIVMVLACAMAWDGFHYSFTRHGVEIRTLGFRLKSIPLLQIKKYEVGNWNPLRGYGIRGIGNHKAYVWGNKGVRVEMFDGEVFLGHADPQRIVRDLNVITNHGR